MTYIAPELNKSPFCCPNCNITTSQEWANHFECHFITNANTNMAAVRSTFIIKNSNYSMAKCLNCQQISLWRNNKMVYPLIGNTEQVNEDMPDEIKRDYKEAQDIFNISPRGSAALLRLVIQKICIYLDEKGTNLNDDIASLVTKGLPVYVQQALDSVRVIGNNALHPGQIDLSDNKEVAEKLFKFVNVICTVLISNPKAIGVFYKDMIPESNKNSINKRDNT
jgi:endogenous inhibitor of DNA gyrase (YacG/DUF329 family)